MTTTPHGPASGQQPGQRPSGAELAGNHAAAATARLRHCAIQASYRGQRHPDRAFAIASILDDVSLRWRYQDPAVAAELLAFAHLLLTDDPPGPPTRTIPASPVAPADPTPPAP